MTSMTPEEIRQHVGEVWEDDVGNQYRLIAVLDNPSHLNVVYLRVGDALVGQVTTYRWLHDNNLPQSLRKAKPRMVKAPGWRIWITEQGKAWTIHSYRPDEVTAKEQAKLVSSAWESVAIQAPDSDMMEVVKGFEGN